MVGRAVKELSSRSISSVQVASSTSTRPTTHARRTDPAGSASSGTCSQDFQSYPHGSASPRALLPPPVKHEDGVRRHQRVVAATDVASGAPSRYNRAAG